MTQLLLWSKPVGWFVCLFVFRHRSLPTSRGNPKHRGFYYCLILPPLLGKQHAVQLTLLTCSCLLWSGASLVVPLVKNPPAIWETWLQSLDWEDPLEKGMATHSDILAWKIPWTIVHGVTKSQTRLSNFHFTSLLWSEWWPSKHDAICSPYDCDS